MVLAVLSDIHGNLDALDAVLADISRRGITDIVNLGDSLSGPFDAAGTADRLIGLDMPTIAGNHDRELIDRTKSEMGNWESWVIDDLTPAHLEWIRGMSKTKMVGDVFLCHGTPTEDDENWLDFRGPHQRLIARDLDEVEARRGTEIASLFLCGHTHQPRVVTLSDGTLVANPGSVGCPAYLDKRAKPHFIQQTGSPDARYGIVEKLDGRWHINLMTVPYDSKRMAKLAREKGADNWAQAVTAGWFA